MPAARSLACVISALLLPLAAEWVEISQQRYRKPARPHQHPQEPAPTIYPDLLAPDEHPFLGINAQNPTKTHSYQDVDPTRTTFHYENPARGGAPERDQRPALRNDNQKHDRLNTFIDESETRNSYDYQHVSKNVFFVPETNKPSDFPTDQDLFLTPTSETYANQTVTEQNWNQNLRLQNNVRNDIKFATKETTFNDRTQFLDERSKYAEAEMFTEITELKEHGSVAGKIERVSNIGSVKRVKLANTPVKSPIVKINKVSETHKRRNDVRPTHMEDYSGELDLKTDVFKNTHIEKVFLEPSKNFSKILNTKQGEISIAQVEEIEKAKDTLANTDIPLKNLHGHFTQKHKLNDTTRVTKYNLNNQGIDEENNKEINKMMDTNNKPNEGDLFIAKTEYIASKIKDPIKTANTDSDSVEYENKHNKENESGSQGEITSGELKVNTMEKMLTFIKVVADTISKNTRTGADGKITYLNELKHTLLTNIKARVDATWPEEGSRRRQRSARGHVEVPSSESALMTISFLTFAVFLIKLVLQVIQTYKHKTMMMAPLVVATAGRRLAKKRATTKHAE